MSTDTIIEQDAVWKQKYLDLVESAEQSQRSWQKAEEALRHTIARLALAARGLDPKLDQQLDRVRAAIRDRVDHLALSAHIDALSQALLELDRKRGGDAPAAAAQAQKPEATGGLFKRMFKHDASATPVEAATDTVSADRLLLDLLERIDLPDDLNDQARTIRSQIESGLLNRDWRLILQEIAELIEAMRVHAKQENAGMQEFLTQISERLKEVDHHLRGSVELNNRGADNRRSLDDAVCREVKGIESSVRDAVELSQLKSAVQARLESVGAQMARFRQAEDARDVATRDHLEGMRRRVDDLEVETRQLREQVEMERLQATTDVLTEIPNRLAYEQRLKEDIARRRRFGTSLILMVWDVDRFKSVNDSYGHKAGDKVLKKIAQLLYARARETDFVARYGGEEFVMIMTGTTLEESLAVANELRKLIEKTGFHFRGQAVNITVSCGLSEFMDRDSAADLFERADSALYRAKDGGRNRCVAG